MKEIVNERKKRVERKREKENARCDVLGATTFARCCCDYIYSDVPLD